MHFIDKKCCLGLLLLLVSHTSIGQTEQKTVPFKKSNYSATDYSIQSKTYPFSGMKIEVIEVKAKKPEEAPSIYCRAWINVKKGDRLLRQLYYDNMEPVGGEYGIVVPDKQPCSDMFILSKFGDYEGEIIIIDSSGEIVKEPGGEFSISSDMHYLFSPYDSDISGVTVYDLQAKKVVFSEEYEDAFFDDFYYQDGQYFSIIGDSDGPASSPKNIKIVVIDLKAKKLQIKEKPAPYPQEKCKLKRYND